MDWDRYKARCDSPEVWSRWMLEQTIELLSGDPQLAGSLGGAIATGPLVKPPGHKGGAATDMFELHLSAKQVDAVAAAVRRAVDGGEETEGTRGRGLGGFLEAWMEYRQFVTAVERRLRDAASAGQDACSPKS